VAVVGREAGLAVARDVHAPESRGWNLTMFMKLVPVLSVYFVSSQRTPKLNVRFFRGDHWSWKYPAYDRDFVSYAGSGVPDSAARRRSGGRGSGFRRRRSR